MYHVAIVRRQGANTEYRSTDKVCIHGNFLELPLGEKTHSIDLSGVKEIVESENTDEW